MTSITNQLIPDSMDFQPSPLRSSGSMRQAAREELLALLQMQAFSEAISTALKALDVFTTEELSSSEREAFKANMGEFQTHLQNREAADNEAEIFATLFGLSAASFDIIDRAGEHYYLKRDYETAIGIYTLAALLNHTGASVWSRRALALQGAGRHEEAIECFKLAGQIAPEDPGPLLLEARCYKEMGNEEEVKRCKEKGQRLMNLSPEYQETWGSYI